MKKWKKARNFGGGVVVFKIINFISYTVLGTTIVMLSDIIIGTFIVILLISIRSFLLIFIYDTAQKDVFFIEEKKEKRLQAHLEVVRRNKKSRIKETLLFIFFILWDPAITVLYYRDGAHLFNGIQTKKLKILFILSSISSTMIWLLGLNLVKPYLKYFLELLLPYIWQIILEFILLY